MDKGILLFSVDLEDVRDGVENGDRYQERVPVNTERYLDFLRKHKIKGTFFIVGNLARQYPALVKSIAGEGHEIACHSNAHVQLTKQSPESFRRDINDNLEALYRAGAENIIGFRAPTFSLTSKTAWAYDILGDLGFQYSSSVLPARNPLYGWPDFGGQPKQMGDSLWEIPITLHSLPGLNTPVAGGVYFRIIPFFLIRFSVKRHVRENRPILTYLHPYDIDEEQERFMHPDLSDNKLLNYLMYVNRSKVFARLEGLRKLCGFTSYQDYVQGQLAKPHH